MADAKDKGGGSTTSDFANWAQRCETEVKAPIQWEHDWAPVYAKDAPKGYGERASCSTSFQPNLNPREFDPFLSSRRIRQIYHTHHHPSRSAEKIRLLEEKLKAADDGGGSYKTTNQVN